jgi:hypothetical protein
VVREPVPDPPEPQRRGEEQDEDVGAVEGREAKPRTPADGGARALGRRARRAALALHFGHGNAPIFNELQVKRSVPGGSVSITAARVFRRALAAFAVDLA